MDMKHWKKFLFIFTKAFQIDSNLLAKWFSKGGILVLDD